MFDLMTPIAQQYSRSDAQLMHVYNVLQRDQWRRTCRIELPVLDDTDMNVVGYTDYANQVLCVDCAYHIDAMHYPLYRVEVGIHSQTCASCNTLIVDGLRDMKGEPVLAFPHRDQVEEF